jgi:hypothetical protein
MTQTPAAPAAQLFVPVEGMIEAPIVYFEVCPTFGNNGGLINVMLAAALIELAPNDRVATRIKAVAHLRTTAGAAANLRDTIDKALLMGAPVENPEGPAN